MEELAIRRRRDFPPVRPAPTAKAEKTAAPEAEPARASRPAATDQLTAAPNAGEDRFRQSHQILQTGESALAEVSDSLGRMDRMLQETGSADSLPDELKAIAEEIDRLLDGASVNGVQLFQEGDDQPFPDWLQNGVTLGVQNPDEILAALGLIGKPDAEQILNALLRHPLGTNSATDYLSTLYLGAIIAGNGKIPENLDQEAILKGVQQLLELVNDGVSFDQAIAGLSGGTFPNLASFEAQFGDGTAPDLMSFLSKLLLTEEAPVLPPLSGLLNGLDGLGGMEMDLWMALGSMQILSAGRDGAEAARTSLSPDINELEAVQPERAAGTGADGVQLPTLRFGELEVSGSALSGVSFDENVLTLDGQSDVTVRGVQPDISLRIRGSGSVILDNARASALVIDAPEARVFTAGESVLNRIELRNGTALVLDGGGLLRAEQFKGTGAKALRLSGGTLLVNGGGETLPAKVEVNGPAILPAGMVPAARGGAAPTSFDLIWKTLLPGAERLIAAAVDGQPVGLFLLNNSPVKLWLDKAPDGSHGYPAHLVVLTGRDELGGTKSHSLFLHWDGGLSQYQEVPMYPNPFQVSGGVEGEDWVYDPASRTLRILSARPMTVSGGPGLDARQNPFSGRIVLEDGLGASDLTLNGADCQVSFGRAFDLGRNNQVTLFLRGENAFQSGVGCAGLSLGNGTSLLLDAAPGETGSLTASGGYGGAGIGRDRGTGLDRACRIVIRGGSVTARAFGAGAGIGAGRDGGVGPVSISGGTIFAFGGRGGGAAIGGASGGPVGDITIFGGEITVSAPSLSDPIGAGAGSVCGEVRVSRAARIITKDRALEPPASKKPKGIPLDLGAETVLLPRFQLSAEGLRIRDLDLSTPSGLLDAQRNVSEASRRVWRIHLAYNEMFSRLEEHLYSLWNVSSSLAAPVRSQNAARDLLSGVKQAIAQHPARIAEGRQESAAGEIFRLLRKP